MDKKYCTFEFAGIRDIAVRYVGDKRKVNRLSSLGILHRHMENDDCVVSRDGGYDNPRRSLFNCSLGESSK